MAESTDAVIARLDERLNNMEKSITQMADAMSELARSNNRILVIESDVVSLKDGQKKLWTHCGDVQQNIDKIEDRLNGAGWKVLMRIAEFISAIAVGYLIFMVTK